MLYNTFRMGLIFLYLYHENELPCDIRILQASRMYLKFKNIEF